MFNLLDDQKVATFMVGIMVTSKYRYSQFVACLILFFLQCTALIISHPYMKIVIHQNPSPTSADNYNVDRDSKPWGVQELLEVRLCID